MKYLVEQLYAENQDILLNRPDLAQRGDFSEQGMKYHSNKLKMKALDELPVMLLIGKCLCAKPIVRTQYRIKFCAWCHKESTTIHVQAID